MTTQRSLLVFGAVVALSTAATAHAGDLIEVGPGPEFFHHRIQDAVDAAAAGDMVLVHPGVYTGEGNKEIEFYGKDIALRGLKGPLQTIVDCEGSGRGFYIRGGETPAARLAGLTVRNGFHSDYNGGGIRVSGSSPTIAECIIADNQAYAGGGIRIENGSAATVRNCLIQGNRASFAGGVYIANAAATIVGCTISGNTAGEHGGGITCHDDDSLVADCVIVGNQSGTVGGLAARDHSRATVLNCQITGNTGGHTGGVKAYSGATPSIENCTIADNTGVMVGGIHCVDGTYYYFSRPTFTRCIVWGNWPQQIVYDSGELTVTYSDIYHWWPGEGNIDGDPLFTAGPAGGYYLSQTAAGQPATGAAVDAGDVPASAGGLDGYTTRTDGATDTGTVDLGYHYPAPTSPVQTIGAAGRRRARPPTG